MKTNSTNIKLKTYHLKVHTKVCADTVQDSQSEFTDVFKQLDSLKQKAPSWVISKLLKDAKNGKSETIN